MAPVIVIVGRPNVGKSTLFNRITRTRDALVADRPGVTRDRRYGFGEYNDTSFILIDTGGIGNYETDTTPFADQVSEQSFFAINEADIVFWLVDGRNGLTTTDEILAEKLRTICSKMFLLINKTEGMPADIVCADFHALGVGTPLPISSAHGDGVSDIMDLALAGLPVSKSANKSENDGVRISIIGRPNVGKSTLINHVLGEPRMLIYDEPGTTRDSITIPFERNGQHYELVDTAGVRRRSRVTDQVEKLSILKSLQVIESAEIIIAVLDATEAITDQDLYLLGITAESGKPLVIAINKWDMLTKDQKTSIRSQVNRKLTFVEYACLHYISALKGSGIGKIFSSINSISRSIELRIKSSALTAILTEATTMHPPHVINGRRIKLRYAHLGGHNPLRVIIHGNQTARIPANYVRYLENFYRKRLRIVGTPVFIQFKYGDNPYKHRKNVLTKKQFQKRKRLIKHSGK